MADGYERREFAVLVKGLPELVIPCEEGRDALRTADLLAPHGVPVVRWINVSDWTVIDGEYAT